MKKLIVQFIEKPIVIVVLIVVFGFALRHFMFEPNVANPTPAMQQDSSEALFAAKFQDLAGNLQALSQYKGKILIVNFWATWCPPCREEMPELSKMQDQYRDKNVVILGIATDELVLVQEFAKAEPVSYPLFAADQAGMDLAQTIGNNQGVLPYTAIVRPDGSIANVYFGMINQATLEQTLIPIVDSNSAH